MELIKFLKAFAPPATWRFVVIILLGIFSALFFLLCTLAEQPHIYPMILTACVNCHVMAPQFATWQNSSHGRVTVCNDCHVPQNNIFEKYFFKASRWVKTFLYVYIQT